MNEQTNAPWIRKHDVSLPARRIVYPQSLQDLIQLCKEGNRFFDFFRKRDLCASGSHWALSDAGVSDHTFVETHDPNNVEPAMGKTLYHVVPNCLTDACINYFAEQVQPSFTLGEKNSGTGDYLVHFETGKRIYQLYAELDQGEENNPKSLAYLLKKQS